MLGGGLLCLKFGARLCEPQQCPGNNRLFIELIAFELRTLLRVTDPRSAKVAQHRMLAWLASLRSKWGSTEFCPTKMYHHMDINLCLSRSAFSA
jgi:hypothetical protein